MTNDSTAGAPRTWTRAKDRELGSDPLPPDRIDLPADRPVYQPVDGPDPSPTEPTMHAWGPADADGVRRYIGRGRLVGWLRRERAYSQDGYQSIAFFLIGDGWHRAANRNDVALAVVEGPDGRYLPSYPRCPDCGGAVEYGEAVREFAPVQLFDWPDHGPGSRECAECGSRFSER